MLTSQLVSRTRTSLARVVVCGDVARPVPAPALAALLRVP
jgi:hypothetical protein